MTFDVTALVIVGVLGVMAGLFAGAMFWRSALEVTRQHNEYLMRASAMGKEIDRYHTNELLYWQELATRDGVFLDALGARAGLLTLSDGTTPWATQTAREHAAAMYHDARRRLTQDATT